MFSINQSIHQILRDPTVMKKQLFFSLCGELLNNISVGQLYTEWREHIRSFPFRGKGLSFEDYVITWANALKKFILQNIMNLLNDIIHMVDTNNYIKYIDWITTIGIVPIKNTNKIYIDKAVHSTITSSKLLSTIYTNNFNFLQHLLLQIHNIEIPNFYTTVIFKNLKTENIECYCKNKKISTFIFNEPIFLDKFIFTTPVGHLYKEIIKHDSLRRHIKLCQLLNTFPVKVVSSSRVDFDNKKIMELIEKEEKNTDAKKSLMKFLLNLSNSKTKIGIQDSIESFLQDLTPSIIDHDKLLPGKGIISGKPSSNTDTDIKEIFKKQVIKCMEEQIETQINEINTLKDANKLFESKIRDLKNILQSMDTVNAYDVSLDRELDTVPLATALNTVYNIPFKSVQIEGDKTVNNSFISQYVPNVEYSDKRLSKLWEIEYNKTYHLRKNMNNQGIEESTTYSNYTIDLLLTPFLTKVLKIPTLNTITEEILFLSYSEILQAVYEQSKIKEYLRLICNREISLYATQFSIPFQPIENKRKLEDDPEIQNKVRKLFNQRQIQHLNRENYFGNL